MSTRSAAAHKAHRSQLIGAVILLVFLLLLAFALTVQKKVPLRPYTYVNASFTDVGGLRVGDDVREHSVRIGQVSSIRTENGVAVATMQINGHKDIDSDATAALRARSSLGQTYIDLTPGSNGQKLSSSDAGIPVTATTSQVQLDDVLDVFNAQTRTSAGDDIKTLGDGTAGHEQDISDFLSAAPSLLTNLGVVSKAAADPKTDLPTLLQTANQLSQHLSGEQAQLASLVGTSATTIDALNPAGGALDQSLADLPGTLQAADKAFTDLQEPLSVIQDGMTAVQPAAVTLGQQTAEIRQTLRQATPVLGKVPPVAKQALPAVTSLTTLSADLRPLAAPVNKGLSTAQNFADTLAPYGTEAGAWFDNWSSALSQGDSAGHWLRLDTYIDYLSVTGNTGTTSPGMTRDPYPAPGVAVNETAGGSK